jgi:hypothetical protein
MGSWNYIRADQVLPARLLKEIRQYATGLLYIPTDLAQDRQRTVLHVRALKEQGFRNCDIARALAITPRRVCGILKGSDDTTDSTTSASS